MEIQRTNSPNFAGLVKIKKDGTHIKWGDITEVIERGSATVINYIKRENDSDIPYAKPIVTYIDSVMVMGYRAEEIAKAEGVGKIVDLTI